MTNAIDIPGYQLIRPIGKGGMATVYLAIQESFQREVALKIMAPSLSDNTGFSERFLHEARVVSRLIHPHIVTVYDVGIHQGHHYLSMEYVPGQELKTCLADLSGDNILRVMREIASALDYASQKGCVHRDVKPENILLHEESGRAVLMDFGIAKADDIGSGMTQTGMALGTPYYMSPEQARGQKVDGRADLYSLGIVFYKMLTGQVPYTGDSAVTIAIKHISEPVPKLPAKLAIFQPVLAKLLNKDSTKRYQRGRDLIADLDKLSGAIIDKTRKQCFIERMDSLASRSQRAVTANDLTQMSAAVIDGKDDKRRRSPVLVWLAASGLSLVTGLIYYESFGLQFPPTAQQYEALKQRLGLSEKPVLTLEGILAQSTPVDDNVVPLPGGLGDKSTPLDVDIVLDVGLGGEAFINTEHSANELGGSVALVKHNANALIGGEQVPGSMVVASSVSEPSEKTDPAKFSPAVLERLQQQTEQIERQYRSGELKLADVLSHYRAILVEQPDDVLAFQRLNVLENDQLEAIDVALLDIDSTAINNEALHELKLLLDNALIDFPALLDNKRFQRFITKYQAIKALSQQLTEAQVLFDKGLLIVPADKNALTLYNQVLSKEPANKAAQQGLIAIGEYFFKVAQKSYQAQRYQQAIESVKNGLNAVPQHAELLVLKSKLATAIDRQQQVASLIAEAKKLEAQQQWFGDRSAAERLLGALAIDTNNKVAQQSLDRLVTALLTQVDDQMLAKALASAQQLLTQALLVLPNDQRLLAKKTTLNAMQPTVDKVVFSGEAFDDLTLALPDKFKAGRVLYVGFNYKNFVNKTTVLQAMLFDGVQTVEIAAAPVIVSGYEGQKFFKINRPVEGFKAGGYRLDILLEGNRVASQPFVVLP